MISADGIHWEFLLDFKFTHLVSYSWSFKAPAPKGTFLRSGSFGVTGKFILLLLMRYWTEIIVYLAKVTYISWNFRWKQNSVYLRSMASTKKKCATRHGLFHVKFALCARWNLFWWQTVNRTCGDKPGKLSYPSEGIFWWIFILSWELVVCSCRWSRGLKKVLHLAKSQGQRGRLNHLWP